MNRGGVSERDGQAFWLASVSKEGLPVRGQIPSMTVQLGILRVSVQTSPAENEGLKNVFCSRQISRFADSSSSWILHWWL